MSKHVVPALVICGTLLVGTAAADITIEHNVAFNATKRNPYTGGAAFDESKTHTLLNESFGPVNIPTVNADPVSALLEAFLGVDLPSIAKLQIGGSVAAHAKVEFGYSVTSGRLDINYPATSQLNVQTVPGGNHVLAGQSYAIGSQFQAGVLPRTVTSQFLETEGGAGYLSAPLLAFNTYEQPTFATTSPWASAWLDAEADVRAGVFSRVTALGGLQEWRKDFRAGGKVGSRLFEIDPSGLYVSGEPIANVDLDQPIGPFPVAGGAAELTVRVPRLGVASTPSNGPIVNASAVKPIVTLTGNMEKLIPFVGGFLHNSIGPFEYDLLQLKGGPELGLYQEMSFTPDPQLKLSFSEPVLVRGNPCADDAATICGGAGSLQETVTARVPLGSSVDWQPMFTNSSSVTITPTYLFKNSFRNETGVELSLVTDVEALSLKSPFFPTTNNTIGPIIDTEARVPLGRAELFTRQFEIPLPSVTGDAIVVPKVNVGLEIGLGDLNLATSNFVGADPENPQSALWDLTFNRTVQGGPPRQYQVRVSGLAGDLTPPGGGEGDSATVLRTSADVILTDPVTSQQYAVGRRFCLTNCDLSAFQPDASPYFDDPNPTLGKLYVTHLPDDPNIDVDVQQHPILGSYNGGTPVNTVDSTEYGVEFVDKLNGPASSIVVREREIVPDRVREFEELSTARLLPAGEVLILSAPNPFDGGPDSVYLAADTNKVAVVRVGDVVRGGGQLGPSDFQGFPARSATNDSGQVALIANIVDGDIGVGTALFRGGADGLTTIARDGEALSNGGGAFITQFNAPQMNQAGQVAFNATVVPAFPETTFRTAILLGNGSELTTIVRNGELAPDTNSTFEYIDPSFSLSNSGRVVFSGLLADGRTGVYAGDGLSITKVAATGDAAPSGGSFASAFGAQQNNSGQVAFLASVVDSLGGAPVAGLYRTDGLATQRIAQVGQLAPDGDGRFADSSFLAFQMNEAGQVLFHATVEGAVNYEALYVGNEDDLRRAARIGMPAPGGGLLNGLGDARLNNNGQVAFTADLSTVVGDDEGVMLYDGRNLIELVRVGQSFGGSTVVNANVGDINDKMQVAYDVQLADGRSMIARFEPTLYWRSPGIGLWGAPENWSLLIEPFDPYDAHINSPGGGTVKIPFGNGQRRTINSLTIGSDSGAATSNLELENGVTLEAINGTTLRSSSYVGGEGTIAGTVFNLSGTINPGPLPVAAGGEIRFVPGELHIDGDYFQGVSATLIAELRGTMPGVDHDRLAISGLAELGGTLQVALLDGYQPSLGDQFSVLTFSGRSERFNALSMPVLPSDLDWRVIYGATDVVLLITPSTPGDTDFDGDVDLVDLNHIRNNFGQAGLSIMGDTNADGIVDLEDLNAVRNNFGRLSEPVPEPNTLMLLVVTFACTGIVGRCRPRQRVGMTSS